jgi:hypothetical protein
MIRRQIHVADRLANAVQSPGRERMLAAAGTTDYATLLGTKEGLHAITSWLIRQGVLQFKAAKEVEEEDRSGWWPLQPFRM